MLSGFGIVSRKVREPTGRPPRRECVAGQPRSGLHGCAAARAGKPFFRVAENVNPEVQHKKIFFLEILKIFEGTRVESVRQTGGGGGGVGLLPVFAGFSGNSTNIHLAAGGLGQM